MVSSLSLFPFPSHTQCNPMAFWGHIHPCFQPITSAAACGQPCDAYLYLYLFSTAEHTKTRDLFRVWRYSQKCQPLRMNVVYSVA